MLVMQNDQTVFEHYANGGRRDGAGQIFSGTKSFWGIAALCAVHDGLIKLDDRVADTITEWKNRHAQIADHDSPVVESNRWNRTGARISTAIRSAIEMPLAIQLPLVAAPGSDFAYGPSHLQIFSTSFCAEN